MPPSKSRPVQDDARSDASTVRERQIAAAAHARKSKNLAAKQAQGKNQKDLALVNNDSSTAAGAGQGTGMAWNTAPLDLLNAYRVSHSLPSPAAFTSPLHQAILTNPGIGRHSPTMARKKENRRISREQLALAVRKNFNAAAVNEIDVVVDLVYKVRNQNKAFRMHANPGVSKK